MTVRYKVFRAIWSSWKEIFDEASDFATRIGKDRIINISHSCDKNDGVVTVWYWR